MRIATFNANSIRVRVDAVLDWMAEYEPDALFIQETKCEDAVFPLSDFEDAGLHVVMDGQKTYNGVAIVSKFPLQDVQKGMGDPAWPDDKRILRATLDGVRLVNTYVPNGTKVGSEKWEYKLNWLTRFESLLAAEMARYPNLVWAGDINIAPEPKDVFDSPKMLGGVCHHPDEFARLAKIKELGLTDCYRQLYPDKVEFSYFEFVIPRSVERKLGWRIDHIYVTESLKAGIQECVIDREPRLRERPSDHTFVYADLEL